MFATVWHYEVADADQGRFQEIYGADGVWARLFARHPRFIGTRLYRDTGDTGAFLTVDLWQAVADFDAFKQENGALYDRLDRCYAGLSRQTHLGTVEGAGLPMGQV